MLIFFCCKRVMVVTRVKTHVVNYWAYSILRNEIKPGKIEREIMRYSCKKVSWLSRGFLQSFSYNNNDFYSFRKQVIFEVTLFFEIDHFYPSVTMSMFTCPNNILFGWKKEGKMSWIVVYYRRLWLSPQALRERKSLVFLWKKVKLLE